MLCTLNMHILVLAEHRLIWLGVECKMFSKMKIIYIVSKVFSAKTIEFFNHTSCWILIF